jgi:hypothetical protein
MMTMMNGPVVRRLLVALVCALPAACVAQAGDITDEDGVAADTAQETAGRVESPESPKAATTTTGEQLGERRQERSKTEAPSKEAEEVNAVGIPAVPSPDKPQPAPWQPNGMDTAGEDPAPAEKPQPAPWTGPHPPIGPNASPSDVTSAD